MCENNITLTLRSLSNPGLAQNPTPTVLCLMHNKAPFLLQIELLILALITLLSPWGNSAF